jgi:acetylornithine/N-succinyldiaminopimelate aminotransferase
MQQSFASIMPITPRPDIIFTQGQGAYLIDNQGKRYLDFVQGWAVNTLGHCPAVISQALCAQSTQLLNPSPAFYNQPMLTCADLLTQHSVFDRVFFANSGAEANEGAIKLARKWGTVNKNGAYKIITFDNGFHGRTLTTMAASGKAAFEPLFEPKTPGFIKIAYNDVSAVEQAIDSQTVAIMLELIQGEAGVIPAQLEFVQQLRQLADQYGLLLMVDEVQTGVGRTGNLFAYQAYGIEPDIMTLGKGLGGGVPIAALLAKQPYCVFKAGEQGGTYNGNPLMTAVASAVLNEVLSSTFLSQVQTNGVYLRQTLQALSAQFGLGEVRGQGLLLALDTGALDANAIVQRSLALGLLINAPRSHTLRFMPALNVSQPEIQEMAGLLAQALATV